MKRRLAILLALLSAGVHASTGMESLTFANDAQERTYNSLIQDLRCLVCQNQNIADSNAELAHDLRQETYEMVSAGKSASEIVDFMVARYGDFVLYKPPVRGNTLLLWGAPFALGIGGVLGLVWFIRRRAAAQASTNTALSDAERQRLAALLDENND